jgi:hypothetical protein
MSVIRSKHDDGERGTVGAIGFVASMNLRRRHMDESQRAMVAARLANMPRGGVRQGQNTTASQTANLQSEITQTEAAALLSVSPRSVATAAKVDRDAIEPISRAVDDGVISLNLASQVAELPREAQEVVAAAPLETIKEAARDSSTPGGGP